MSKITIHFVTNIGVEVGQKSCSTLQPKVPKLRHIKDLLTFKCVSLAKGTSDLPRVFKRCFEGFVSPRNSLISFYRSSQENS